MYTDSIVHVLIQTNKLCKTYGTAPQPALNELSISIQSGEVYGFLGSNGAGKSTAIRTLLNFIQPSSGSATICGLDIVNDSVKVKRHVGYLAGDVALYGKMSGQELLDYLSTLQPIKHTVYYKSLVKSFEAELHKPINELSKGNRQKIGLLQALMHEPEVLILDEPTSGLDPLMQEVFYSVVIDAKKRGAAVFVSSHNLNEVQHMCDRVGIIRNGKLIKEQYVTTITNAVTQSFAITFRHHVPADLSKIAGVKVEMKQQRTVTVSIADDLSPLLAYLSKHNVERIVSRQSDLEQDFLHLYGDPS